MAEIIKGIILMFIIYSIIQFWVWFIELEETKQIKVKDYIFKKEKKK